MQFLENKLSLVETVSTVRFVGGKSDSV